MNRTLASLIAVSALVFAMVIGYVLLHFDKVKMPFGSIKPDATQSDSTIATVETSTYHQAIGDGRNYLRVEYAFVVGNKRYRKSFTATSGLGEMQRQFSPRSTFRFCYEPKYPQFGYIPKDTLPCGLGLPLTR